MNDARDPVDRLARLLSRLPGIGEKTALRLSLAIARREPEFTTALAAAIAEVRDRLQLCERCCDLSGTKVCAICADSRRDQTTICVVAQAQDRMAIERAASYRGLYHVLHGVLDPLSGVGPNELKIESLLARLEIDEVRELIIATSPNVEGDATALYIAKLVTPLGVNVSRIASGVAVGGELEYADISTLSRALDDRRPLNRFVDPSQR